MKQVVLGYGAWNTRTAASLSSLMSDCLHRRPNVQEAQPHTCPHISSHDRRVSGRCGASPVCKREAQYGAEAAPLSNLLKSYKHGHRQFAFWKPEAHEPTLKSCALYRFIELHILDPCQSHAKRAVGAVVSGGSDKRT